MKESCQDPDYPSQTNCTKRFWVAGEVDNLQAKLNNISNTLRDIGPVWKNQFISLFAFLPWSDFKYHARLETEMYHVALGTGLPMSC